MLVLLSFIHRENDSTVCWKLAVDVDISDGNYFVDEEIVRNTIYDLGDSVVGTSMNDISIHKLRNAILRHEAVKAAFVTKTIDGQVKVKVEQRVPIARILLDEAPGYYVDAEGNIMPLSDKFTAHVPVFTGHLAEPVNEQQMQRVESIYRLSDFIRNDEFLNAQVEHVYVDSSGEFDIIPRVGTQRIKLGNANDLTMKFKKLKIFYDEIRSSGDLNAYTIIDLRFRDQVVCEKKPW